MSHIAAKSVRSQRNNLIAAIAVCDIAFGLTFPLMSFGATASVNALPTFFIVLYASLAVLLFASGGRLVRVAA